MKFLFLLSIIFLSLNGLIAMKNDSQLLALNLLQLQVQSINERISKEQIAVGAARQHLNQIQQSKNNNNNSLNAIFMVP